MDDDEYPRYISLVGLRDALSHRQFQGAPCSRISHSKQSEEKSRAECESQFFGGRSPGSALGAAVLVR